MLALRSGHAGPTLPEQDDPASFPVTCHLQERLKAISPEVITLLLWQLSVKEDDELFFTPLAFLGVRWRICTSRSLGRAQQATFLVTLAEVVFIWGPFIPSPRRCLTVKGTTVSREAADPSRGLGRHDEPARLPRGHTDLRRHGAATG